MKRYLFTFTVAAFALTTLLSGCGKKTSKGTFDYLPVQMSKGESWSIIDKDGNVVVKEEYPADSKLSLIYEGVYWVYSNEKYQLYNLDNPKKPVIDEEFASATTFHAGVAVVGNPNQQIRIIDTNGKTVATLGKDIKRCEQFTDDGYAVIHNTNNKEGLIDTKGNIVIAPTYFELYSPNEGLLIAQKEAGDNKALILNVKGEKQGEVNLEKYYILNETISEGKLLVRKADDTDAPTVVLNTKGEKLFEIKKAKEEYRSSIYLNNHVVFSNGEAIGVADDKGEVVIRPKYKVMINLSNDNFAARKEDKWGIINIDDETIIDFDYDEYGGMMGDNYIMQDGSSWSIIGKDGKEVVSFDKISAQSDTYVDYIDVSSITDGVYNFISNYEQGLTPAQLAKQLSLSIDDCHYQGSISTEYDADGKAKVELKSYYEGYVANEKTHDEEVNDGWFTTQRTVSDGWEWSTEIPTNVTATINLTDESINQSDLYKALLAKFAEGRTKISDNVFSKNINAGGSSVECRTTVDERYGNIEVNISFLR